MATRIVLNRSIQRKEAAGMEGEKMIYDSRTISGISVSALDDDVLQLCNLIDALVEEQPYSITEKVNTDLSA